MRRDPGLTLIEVMVAAALTLLMLGLVYAYLVPSIGSAYKLQQRSHLQQNAVIALARIESAATETSPGGFSWTEKACGFNEAGELDPGTGFLSWSDRFELFWWDTSDLTLRWKEWPPGPPAASADELSILSPKRLQPDRLTEVVEAVAPNKILATGVKLFKVSHQGADALEQPVEIELVLQEADETLTVDQRLTFRMENRI